MSGLRERPRQAHHLARFDVTHELHVLQLDGVALGRQERTLVVVARGAPRVDQRAEFCQSGFELIAEREAVHGEKAREGAGESRRRPPASLPLKQQFDQSARAARAQPCMSTFGRAFRVTTFGESHGGAVGCVVDGVPPRMALEAADIQPQLDRRRPGQSALSSARNEGDEVAILSGTEGGVTLGTPIMMLVRNRDHRPADYASLSRVPRPSHADYTYACKYGVAASSGGGRASARETVGRVAAGALAEKWLAQRFGVSIVAYVASVGTVDAPPVDEALLTRAQVDAFPARCPDARAAAAMAAHILAAREKRDSVGGIVRCVVRGVPAGWGEPCFDKLEATLAQAMLSIPSTKGFEVGSGFAGTRMTGSQHNDAFVADGAHLTTRTNNSGGIQGGISNGAPLRFAVAFKPPATIGLPQQTCDFDGQATVLEADGRHDPCVCPRAVPIVEAMAALALADAALLQLAREASALK